MAYRIRLDEVAAEEIRAYVLGLDPPSIRSEAAAAIHEELQKLGRNPRLGSRPRGPFGRPVYTFKIVTDDVTRYLRVVYRYHQNEKEIWITGFAPIDF